MPSFRQLLFFLLVALFFLAVDFSVWTRPLKGLVEKGVNPLKGGIYRTIANCELRIMNFKYSWEELSELRKKVEELERRNATLNSQLADLKAQNSAMLRLLQAPLPPEWRFLPAQVIGRTRYLSIDKGRRERVKEGMVAVFENVLIGRVVETSEKSAKIILPSDADSKIAVKTNGISGILMAEENHLILTEVLQGKEIKVDGLVVTSGENEIFPPNLLIGKIKEVEKEERAVFQKAEVEPLVDYDQLETVFLIIE